ncbi:hypothetical protein M434DRAFT_395383 [Hypoxylon sp. CO27-5]|nr:hypothetical protein M434DRAFT_395383 [Hypoxylon sp. CO27-5]
MHIDDSISSPLTLRMIESGTPPCSGSLDLGRRCGDRLALVSGNMVWAARQPSIDN